MFKLELGSKAHDTVTGFKGTITARIEYLNGCIQYSVRPVVDEKGKLMDSVYFDEDRLEIDIAKPKPRRVSRSGGPQDDCPTDSPFD